MASLVDYSGSMDLESVLGQWERELRSVESFVHEKAKSRRDVEQTVILAQSCAFDKSDLASRMQLEARWSNRAQSESWNLGTA